MAVEVRYRCLRVLGEITLGAVCKFMQFKVFNRSFAVFIFFSEVHDHLFGRFIDLSHVSNLRIALGDVLLIDAQCIHPDVLASSFQSLVTAA